MEDLKKDVRLLRRDLAKGFINQEAIDEMLVGLPDVADQAETIDISLPDDDDWDDDEDDEDEDED